MTKPAPQPKPETGPWISLGNGRFRSASTGRFKYDPNQDPAWRADIQRREALPAPVKDDQPEEQA